MKLSKQSRRDFLAKGTKASLAVGIGSTIVGSSLLSSCSTAKATVNNPFHTGFDQKPLPYDYKALEPYIDAMTMEIHYTKHAAAYAKNLNDAAQAEGIDRSKPLEDIFGSISKYSDKLRNNAGGHYNHELFWQSMRAPRADNRPTGNLLTTIESKFGSFANFKSQFSDAGKNRFGSGWAWLVLYGDKQKELILTSTPNQDNPLMDIAGTKGLPILGLDVWEHAYYLKYQNKRADYIENWWNLVNWDFIQQRYDTAMK
ncbi:superoxide dismutase [Flavihumibacter profundi]|jgi:superoxide dismutase, Fe-Mn family|uniref:superoxide dismutase n=1 Tax=Flavihumibacter profundi TaxID=2716883 RepID=UPI001CC47A74|nr:superoxide dismutase [Flavihumibacter profundi]MBZ5859500.1 superoxide dismutase [Flavihumibacter profundi]